MKNVNLQIQKSQHTASVDVKRFTFRHIIVKLLKIRNKEKNLETRKRKWLVTRKPQYE